MRGSHRFKLRWGMGGLAGWVSTVHAGCLSKPAVHMVCSLCACSCAWVKRLELLEILGLFTWKAAQPCNNGKEPLLQQTRILLSLCDVVVCQSHWNLKEKIEKCLLEPAHLSPSFSTCNQVYCCIFFTKLLLLSFMIVDSGKNVQGPSWLENMLYQI